MRRGSLNREGFELQYCIKGQGYPIVVVGSSVYYPRLFAKALYEKFTFIFLDHRGFVKPISALREVDCTLEDILDDIEAARQHLQLKEFAILGHSGHAFMALGYAKKYPQYVQRVILLNTAPTNSQERQQESFSFFNKTASKERKAQFEKEIAFLEQDIKQDPERRFVHMCIRMGAHSFYDYAFDGLYLWEDVNTNMKIIDYLWGDAFAKLNLIDSLHNVTKPVFIGLGRYDYLVAPVSLWDSVDENNNVKKVIFEYSGHNPMLEEPEVFYKELVQWMSEKL
ncbi:alpha/beta hydrolase [Ectobacillus antri]|jgi:proline iminopeptidase|uniref:Alpha/beta hydrolase n=1 Tax=Ectobacillus antri TaxID=2486280 RepID=A0ABT6H4P8_9BACI|nr:alpha/beta hydrolase [Ectobacillus antri]MDG4658065.1 alpha/beta hydrolase [Ectobacillus antri]MDG5753694.1 alpha/beta hydrolase [Ectobacillus antri]